MYIIENMVVCVLYVMYTQHNFVIIRNWMRNRNTLKLLGIWGAASQPRFSFRRIRRDLKHDDRHVAMQVQGMKMYLTKYIERMGTGVRDMIRRCLDAGLAEPEIRIEIGRAHV